MLGALTEAPKAVAAAAAPIGVPVVKGSRCLHTPLVMDPGGGSPADPHPGLCSFRAEGSTCFHHCKGPFGSLELQKECFNSDGQPTSSGSDASPIVKASPAAPGVAPPILRSLRLRLRHRFRPEALEGCPSIFLRVRGVAGKQDLAWPQGFHLAL